MRDRIECARAIFAQFKEVFDGKTSTSEQWWLEYDGSDDAESGLTGQEVDAGLGVLIRKGLVKKITDSGYQLDDDGFEACLHPHLLDGYLGPRAAAPSVKPGVTINATNMHHAQVGDYNQQTTTYNNIVTSLIQEIEKSADIPDHQKKSWTSTLREIAAHPFTQTAVSALAGLGTALASK